MYENAGTMFPGMGRYGQDMLKAKQEHTKIRLKGQSRRNALAAGENRERRQARLSAGMPHARPCVLYCLIILSLRFETKRP